jgi:hypothetical protein
MPPGWNNRKSASSFVQSANWVNGCPHDLEWRSRESPALKSAGSVDTYNCRDIESLGI